MFIFVWGGGRGKGGGVEMWGLEEEAVFHKFIVFTFILCFFSLLTFLVDSCAHIVGSSTY